MMMLSKPHFICLLCLVLVQLACAQQFNMFRDYSREAVKPSRYAKARVKHDIAAYLTPRQMQMMQQRNGPTTPANSFSNSWTGFEKPGAIAVNRKLLRGEQVSSEQTTSQISPTRAKLQSLFAPENLPSWLPLPSNIESMLTTQISLVEESLNAFAAMIESHIMTSASKVHKALEGFDKKTKTEA